MYKMMKTCPLCIGVWIVTLCFSTAFAGVFVEIEEKDYRPKPSSNPMLQDYMKNHPGGSQDPGSSTPQEPSKGKVTFLVQGQDLVMNSTREGVKDSHTVIFHGLKREAVVVDHRSQSYYVLNSETLKAMAAQVNAVAGQFNMEEMLKNVPVDKRPMVKAMMEKNMPKPATTSEVPVEIKKTKETKVIDGLPTTRYEVRRAKKKTQDAWIADWDKIEGGKEVADVFVKMSDFLNEMKSSFATGKKNQAMGSDGSDVFLAHLKELKGFPVLAKQYDDDGALERESILLSTKQQEAQSTDFQPPKHYRQRSMVNPKGAGS